MNSEQDTTLRVIVFKDGSCWVAQCLEHDIATQAKDLDDIPSRLMMTLSVELKASIEMNGKPFAGINAAPKHFHEMWERKASSFRTTTSVPADGEKVTVELALAA